MRIDVRVGDKIVRRVFSFIGTTYASKPVNSVLASHRMEEAMLDMEQTV